MNKALHGMVKCYRVGKSRFNWPFLCQCTGWEEKRSTYLLNFIMLIPVAQFAKLFSNPSGPESCSLKPCWAGREAEDFFCNFFFLVNLLVWVWFFFHFFTDEYYCADKICLVESDMSRKKPCGRETWEWVGFQRWVGCYSWKEVLAENKFQILIFSACS